MRIPNSAVRVRTPKAMTPKSPATATTRAIRAKEP
jgi:hypothetical protein